MSEDDFRRMLAQQQRYYDEEMTTLRNVYQGSSPETRDRLRRFLAKVIAMDEEAHGWFFSLQINFPIFDETPAGEPVDTHGTISPDTLLLAIEAWDKGEPFVDPFYKLGGDGVPPP